MTSIEFCKECLQPLPSKIRPIEVPLLKRVMADFLKEDIRIYVALMLQLYSGRSFSLVLSSPISSIKRMEDGTYEYYGIVLPETPSKILQHYIDFHVDDEQSHLFMTRNGKIIYRTYFNNVFGRIKQKNPDYSSLNLWSFANYSRGFDSDLFTLDQVMTDSFPGL